VVGADHDDPILATRDRPHDVAMRGLDPDVLDTGGPQALGQEADLTPVRGRPGLAWAELDLRA
jgi:hypothetical protein